MKGILRTALLLYSWVSLQRWLLAIGLGLIVIGHLVQFRSSIAIVVLLLALVLILMPALIVGGIMFRTISAPRTLRLVPHARLKMLIGLLLSLVILAGFVTANVALLKLEAPAPRLIQMGLTSVFVVTLAVETALWLGMFLLSSFRYGLFVWFAVLLAWQALSARPSTIAPAIAWIGAVNLIALLAVGAWSAFAVWYLRARRIARPIWADVSEAGSVRLTKRGESIDLSRESALAIHLLGLPSIGRLAWRGLSMVVILLVLAVTTSLRPGGLMPNSGASLLFLGLFGIVFPTVVVAAGVARRSRTLWIGSGCTREELFRMCERLTWRCFAAIGAPILFLCVGAWIFLPHQATAWPYLLVAAFAPAVCGLYLGLMNVTGWRLIDVTVAVLLVLIGLGSIVGPLFANTPIGPALIVIPIMGLLGALSLRSIAQRRWRRIDWLICKPPRLRSQALRPVV